MTKTAAVHISIDILTTLRPLMLTTSALVLTACGGGGGSSPSSAPPAQTNSPPAFVGATAFTFQENETVQFTLAVSDPDGDAVTISGNSAGDGSFFDVDASTGTVVANTQDQTFNFEEPQDANGDNVYEQSITLSDGRVSRTTTITVTVTDVNEPPECAANPVINFEENFVGDLVDFNAAAIDPEGTTPTDFTLVNLGRLLNFDPESAEKFEFDPATGVLALSDPLDAEVVGVEDQFVADVKIDFGAESVECRQLLQLVDVVGVVKSGIKFSGRQFDAVALGDLDNDNLTEFWINSPTIGDLDIEQPNGYIVLGSAVNAELSVDGGELIALESLNANQAVKLFGNYSIPPNRSAVGNTFELSSIGDLDGDGIGDIAVALEPSPGTNVNDLDPERPLGYILWGNALLNQADGEIDLSDLSPSEGLAFRWQVDTSRLRANVNAGDFNADGIPDVVIATPEAQTGGDDAFELGQIHVVFGTTLRSAKPSGEFDLTTMTTGEGVKFTGGDSFYLQAGSEVRSLSDLFGDSADELLISAGQGAIVIDSTVITDASAGSAVIRFLDIPETKRTQITLQREARISPISGDADGDGLPDVFIERPSSDGPFAAIVPGELLINNPAGREIFFSGTQTDENIILLAHSSLRQTNAASMTFIGDIDDDGRDDLGIVYQPVSGEGATYIVLAKALDNVGAGKTFFIDQMTAADGVVFRNYVSEYFDYRITALQDSDGDLLPEILIVGALDRTEGYLVPSSDITAALAAGVAEIDIQENFNDESGN